MEKSYEIGGDFAGLHGFGMARRRQLSYFAESRPPIMRLAIVAASSYGENGQIAPIPNAEIDVELFGGRLAEPDAGFKVHTFPAERGLAESIEDLVQSLRARPTSLVFYFWGYAVVSEERGPALLLDSPKLAPLTLMRLRRLLSDVADEALVMLDARLAEGSFGSELDAVRAMGSVLSGAGSNISSLIATRPYHHRRRPGPPAFTGLLQMLLDAHTGSRDALTPEALFRAMQAEEVMFADIPAAGCFLAKTSFVLVPGSEDTPPTRTLAPPPVALPPPPPPPLPPPVSASTPAPARAVAPVQTPALASAPAPTSPHALEDPERYRFLYTHFERKGDRDASYRAALCLDALGEADINESLLVSTHRPDGLQPVRSTLSYADWNERLCAGCRQPETTALLRAIGPALGRVGFQHVRRQRRELELPDEARQEPEKSTTTLAKTLHWASRLLCVPATELYVLGELPGSLGLAPGPEQPIVACSRALGSGFSLPELVFLWSRELAFARPEESALCYFPTARELSQLLQAALAVGKAVSMRSIDADARRIASGLKREVRGASLDALEQAAQRFNGSDVLTRATQFMRAAELVAGRVALAACGNLELALVLSQRFPRGRVTADAERRADLLGFTVSPELGQIRATLGVAVG